MKRVLLCGLLLALGTAATAALVGCDDKKKDATPTTGSASAAVTASAAPSASAATTASAAPVASAPAAGESEEDVADEEDFGEEVSKSIDDKNFESELEKLEKEIGK